MSTLYQYFVEGQCEKAFLEAFMHAKTKIVFQAGKVDIFNMILERFSKARALAIKKNTKVVIVYDTDFGNIKILKENIDTILKYASLKIDDIIFMQSVKNFEDEIVCSCTSISSINEVFGTDSVEKFKKKFISHNSLATKLIKLGFDIKKIWIKQPSKPFDIYNNRSDLVKIKR